MLIIVCGLPGTGKSFFSEKLSNNIGALLLSSDRTRAALNLKGNYGPASKEMVYQEVLRKASEGLKSGKNVLLDATFSQTNHLDKARHLATIYQTPVSILEMTADEKTILKRVSRSRKYSEADVDVYELIKEEYEPIPFDHLKLDSSKHTVEELLKQAKAYLQYD